MLGQLPELARDLLGFFLGLAREHGPVARFAYGRVPAYLLSRAEHVHHVLISEARRFSKGTPGFRNLSALLGQGLVTSEGALWKRQRRTIEPLFAPERVAGFVDAMEVECRTTLDQWEELARRGATIDLSADMTRLALRIVGTTLLGADLAPEAERMGDSVAIALAWAREQTYSPLRAPLWIPTPANLRAKAAVRQIDRVVGSLVEARLGAPGVRADLLSLLLSARDPETGASMDPAQVRDEVATLFVAGHETTANLLAWTWMLLARVPAVARRMRRELREVLADRRVAAGDLGSLPFTRAVLEESLRLYPPAWVVPRRALESDTLDGYALEAGAYVFTSPWVTHRLPEYWKDPEGFDPERFLGEARSRLPKYAFFPFGAGGRQCVGAAFAMHEALVALATLARGFRPELVPGHPIEPLPQVTLRPRYPIRVKLHRVDVDDM